jgi:hypothetical protein
MSPLDIALDCISRGWNPVPVKFRSKVPLGDAWQTRTISEQTAPQLFNGAELNVGVVLGPTSNGLTDVDCDCAEAIAIAPYLLSPTAARFGRPSKPGSHRLYVTDLSAHSDSKAAIQFREPRTLKMLVELRIGGEKGAQTVFPGSIHEDGEAIAWEKDGAPAEVEGADLVHQVTVLAAFSLIARRWPKKDTHARHQAALVLGGFLARAGLPSEAAKRAVEAIARAANDEEWQDRRKAAEDAVTAHQNGKKAYGLPELKKTFGKEVAQRAADWLGYGKNNQDTEKDDLANLLARAMAAEGGGKEKQADVLISISRSVNLFHTPAPDSEAYADIIINGHRETHRVRGKGFRQWLRHQYWKSTGSGCNSDAMQVAVETISAKAQFEGEEIKAHIRIAEHDGAIYIDLGDPSWRAIEVTQDGWRIIDDVPVRFLRSLSTGALPMPKRGGSIRLLRPFCNVKTDAEFVLIIADILAVLRPNASYPVLVITGEQGSCKSTLLRLIVRLTDPRSPEQRSLPSSEDDLIVAAKGAHVLHFDNISGLSDWLSDAFCRLSTGGGAGKRKLYTDDDEILFDGRRPVLINGIEDVVTRPDLVDRAIIFTAEPISERKRRKDAELDAEFAEKAPRIFGALLDGLVGGLKNLPTLTITDLPRMADFATWAEACTRAYWNPNTFLNAYRTSLASSVDLIIEASPVGAAVRAFMHKRKADWEGTAHELLPLLDAIVGEKAAREKTWPKRPNGLSGKLRRIAPALRKVGIHIDRSRDTHAGIRMIRIEYHRHPEDRPETSSASSASSAKTGKSSEISDIDKFAADDPAYRADDPLRHADDAADDGEGVIVSTKPLKNKPADDADDADDEIPLCSEGVQGLSDIDAIEEEIRLRAELDRKRGA